MIFSVIAVVSIIFYMIVGGVGASSLPIVGASSLIGELVAILMSCLSFGCALYAFIDIQRAETWGLRCGRKCRKQNHYSLIFSGRVYYIFKIISLVVSILVFIFISHGFSDIGSLIFSSLISAYVIWCIWSLHEALMLGGKAAEDVGFSKDQVTSPSIAQPHVTSHPPTNVMGRVSHADRAFAAGRGKLPAVREKGQQVARTARQFPAPGSDQSLLADAERCADLASGLGGWQLEPGVARLGWSLFSRAELCGPGLREPE